MFHWEDVLPRRRDGHHSQGSASQPQGSPHSCGGTTLFVSGQLHRVCHKDVLRHSPEGKHGQLCWKYVSFLFGDGWNLGSYGGGIKLQLF